jgi:hypothetical protein
MFRPFYSAILRPIQTIKLQNIEVYSMGYGSRPKHVAWWLLEIKYLKPSYNRLCLDGVVLRYYTLVHNGMDYTKLKLQSYRLSSKSLVFAIKLIDKQVLRIVFRKKIASSKKSFIYFEDTFKHITPEEHGEMALVSPSTLEYTQPVRLLLFFLFRCVIYSNTRPTNLFRGGRRGMGNNRYCVSVCGPHLWFTKATNLLWFFFCGKRKYGCGCILGRPRVGQLCCNIS